MSARIITLGALRCLVGDTELPSLLSQRQRLAVLIYLGLERETTRDSLMAVFWPESDTERARHALSQTLYDLRRALGRDWLATAGERLRVTDDLEVDAHRFAAAVAGGEPEHALALYGGPFLAGQYLADTQEFESWVERQRVRLSRLHRSARRESIDRRVEAGDLHRALEAARRWIELDPEEDEAHHRLLELLAAGGQRAQALQHYESYRRALRSQDLQPLDETQALIAGIRQDLEPGSTTGAAPALIAAGVLAGNEPSRTGDATGPGQPPAEQPSPRPTRRQRLARGRGALAAALALALLLTGGWWVARGRLRGGAPAVDAVAVLPFANLSADPAATEYFADGMTEELIHALTQVQGLRVAARTSSFYFKGRKATLPEIARELKVGAVLEGSVRREGSRLRVTAQLIDAASGYHLWSRTYDREIGDVFALQEEIARALAGALRVSLAGGDAPRRHSRDVAAFELYLKGRYFWNRRSPESIMRAAEFFAQAIERDSTYALAYSGLADCYLQRWTLALDPQPGSGGGRGGTGRAGGWGMTPEHAFEEARATANRAVELNPGLAEAHVSLGRALQFGADLGGAEREFRRALDLDPRYPLAHAWLGHLLSWMGRFDPAIRQAREATRLDPLSAGLNLNLAGILYTARRYDQAAAAAHQTLELEPGLPSAYRLLGDVHRQRGQLPEALAEYRRIMRRRESIPGVSPVPFEVLGRIGYIQARSGSPADARATLAELQQRRPRRYRPSHTVAYVYLGLGQPDSAIAALETAFAEPGPQLGVLRDPIWDPLRSEPRFRRLLKDTGIEP